MGHNLAIRQMVPTGAQAYEYACLPAVPLPNMQNLNTRCDTVVHRQSTFTASSAYYHSTSPDRIMISSWAPPVSLPTVKEETRHIEILNESSVELAKLDKTVTAQDFATDTDKPPKTPGQDIPNHESDTID